MAKMPVQRIQTQIAARHVRSHGRPLVVVEWPYWKLAQTGDLRSAAMRSEWLMVNRKWRSCTSRFRQSGEPDGFRLRCCRCMRPISRATCRQRRQSATIACIFAK